MKFSLTPKSKKGAYGIEVVTTVAIELFILLLVVVGIIAGAYALLNSGIFGTNTTQYNLTNGMVINLTQGSSAFFGASTTFFSILIVVVIMIFLGLMLGAVLLFGRAGTSLGKR